MSITSMLYDILKLRNDANAIAKNKVGRRVKRRVAGKLFGRMMRWFRW